MKICELISKNLVFPDLKGAAKEQVLEELVRHLSAAEEEINPAELLKVLLEREKLGSTGIGNGIAIPHGKMKGIKNVIVAFGKSYQGVEFAAMDGKPVHLIFLLVAPENSAGIHLKTLARLSRLLKDTGFRQKLMDTTERQELYNSIIKEDEKY